MMVSKTAIIIVAAGNSSRLGRPKQLLPYGGKTLLTHVVAEALAADLRPVVVVTGAYQEEVAGVVKEEGVGLVYNPDWETGMASGIVAGLAEVLVLEPELKAVVVAVCDQPFISAALLLQLVGMFGTSGKGIVACSYADSVGTPVLFGRRYFEQLLVLSGSEGAKKLLKQYSGDVAAVDFPQGHIDIDTAEDAEKLGG